MAVEPETAHARHNRETWNRQSDEYQAFQLRYGEWIRRFVENGFAVESLIEPRPPADAQSSYRNATDLEWARRWPMEHIWRVRRIVAP